MTADDVLVVNGGVTALGAFSPNLLVSGDDRTNQSAALITHHTIWVREHNYQVDRLAAQFPDWTQEQLFQAARAITEAEWQNVIYSEYLPKLVGANALDDYTGYNDSVNPSVINEWATVAFRFGHDQSSNSFDTLAENGSAAGTFTLADAFNLANASNAIRNGGNSTNGCAGSCRTRHRKSTARSWTATETCCSDGRSWRIPSSTSTFLISSAAATTASATTTPCGAASVSALMPISRRSRADNNLDAATLGALVDVYGNDIDQARFPRRRTAGEKSAGVAARGYVYAF